MRPTPVLAQVDGLGGRSPPQAAEVVAPSGAATRAGAASAKAPAGAATAAAPQSAPAATAPGPSRSVPTAAAAVPAAAALSTAGDFIPATRHAPVGLDLTAFLPANSAKGFGASRILPDGLSSTLTRTGRKLAADDSTVRALLAGHDDFVGALELRLEEVSTCASFWSEGSVKNALAVLGVAGGFQHGCAFALPVTFACCQWRHVCRCSRAPAVDADPCIAADVVKACRFESGALNLDTAAMMVPVLVALLQQHQHAKGAASGDQQIGR